MAEKLTNVAAKRVEIADSAMVVFKSDSGSKKGNTDQLSVASWTTNFSYYSDFPKQCIRFARVRVVILVYEKKNVAFADLEFIWVSDFHLIFYKFNVLV